jgi:uncharacterized protein
MEPPIKVHPQGVKLKSDVLVTGFHGIGATGYWTVKFLIQELKAQRSCFIDYENAPAVASTVGGKISTPYEVFSAHRMSFLKAEVSPVREKENEFFRALADWMMNSGVKEVALVGGLDESLRVDNSKYRIVMSSALLKNGGIPNEPVLEEERMIVGPVASLLNLFEINDFPAFALLAYSNTERVDPRASASAVEFLSKRYGFEINTAPLIRGAEVLETESKVIQDREKSPSTSVYS